MKKNESLGKQKRIRENFQPIAEAKDYALHKMIEAGKHMGKFRYIMLPVLFVFLLVYHFMFALLVQLKMRERMARVVSCILVLALLVTSVNLTAFAVEGQEGASTYATGTTYKLSQLTVGTKVKPGDVIENDVGFNRLNYYAPYDTTSYLLGESTSKGDSWTVKYYATYSEYNSNYPSSYKFTAECSQITTMPTLVPNFTYDATSHNLVATSGSAKAGSISVPVEFKSGYSYYADYCQSATGTYTVTARAQATDGYAPGPDVDVGTVTISKAKATMFTLPQIPEAVPYGTKLSDITLSDSAWSWVSPETIPDAVADGEEANCYKIKAKATDTRNYDWSDVEGFDAKTNYITRTLPVKVTPVAATEENFQLLIPSLPAVKYDANKTLANISLPDNWAFVDETIVPQVKVSEYAATYSLREIDRINFIWGEECDIVGYDANTNKITRNLSLTVNKVKAPTPSLSAKHETIYNKGDGKIIGLTTDMEYGTSSGGPFTEVTNPDMAFAPGTYYVRVKDSDNYSPSATRTVRIYSGSTISITYPSTKTGYTTTAITTGSLGYLSDYKFKVTIDKDYHPTGDGFKVTANGVELTPVRQDNLEYTYEIKGLTENVTIGVTGLERYTDKLTIQNANIDFGTHEFGEKVTAQALEIKNEGNRDGSIKSVSLSEGASEYFELVGSDDIVSKDKTLRSYTICPKSSCPIGTYDATVTVTYYTNAAKTSTDTTTATLKYVVTRKTLAESDVRLKDTTLYYTGDAVYPVLVDKDGNTIDTSEYEVTYSNQTDCGTHTMSISNKEGGNYVIPTKELQFTIAYLGTTDAASLSGTQASGFQWYQGDVTVSASGYKITTGTLNDSTVWEDSITVTDSGVTDLKYRLKRNSDGAITAEKTILVNIDREAPTDLTIKLEENKWKDFISNITFGLFYKDNKDVTLTATDITSAVTLYYCISDKELSLNQVKGNDIVWKKYSSKFGIQEGKNIVYAKAVDEAGNTIYASSEGVFKNTIAPIDEVTSDDLQEIERLIDEIKDILTDSNNHLTQEQREELNKSSLELENKKKRIEDVADELAKIKQEADKLPENNDLRDTDETKVKKIIQDIDQFIKDYSGNLTEEEKAELSRLKAELDKKLKNIPYIITIVTSENGSAGASFATAKSGTIVTLTATPSSGYEFSKWEVVEGSVTVKDNKFTMPAENVMIKAVFQKVKTQPSDEPSTPDDTDAPSTPSNADTPTSNQTPQNTVKPGNTANSGGAMNTATPEKVVYSESKEKPVSTTPMEVTYGNGTISVTVESKDEAGNTTGNVISGVVVSSLENILYASLTSEELKAVENGASAEVRLVVVKQQTNVPKAAQTGIESLVQEKSDEITGMTLGGYIDISMEKRIGNGNWQNITTLNEDLEISIDIPEELQAQNTKYWVVKYHEGKVTLLDDLDNKDNTITIKTNEFSTYAIAYASADNISLNHTGTTDKVAGSAEATEKDSKSATDVWYWWLILLIIVLTGTGYIIYKKKKQ